MPSMSSAENRWLQGYDSRLALFAGPSFVIQAPELLIG